MHHSKIVTSGILVALALMIQTKATAQEKDHVQFIPSSAMLAVMVKPMEAINQPSMELFPHEIATAMGMQELGFDPCKITQFSLFVDSLENMDQPPEVGAIVEFAQPQKIEDMSENILSNLEKGTMAGKTVFEPTHDDDMAPIMLQYSDSIIIVAQRAFLRKMLNAQGAQSKLISLIDQQESTGQLGVYMTMEPVRGLIKDQLPPANQVPPSFRNFLELPDLIESVTLNSDFSAEGTMAISINTASEQDTQRIHEIMLDGMEMGRQAVLMQIQQSMANESQALQDSVTQYVNRVSDYMKKHFTPNVENDGRSLVVKTEAGGGASSAATIGILTGLLLPAVQQTREAARRAVSANNLRQLAIAAHNYESVHQKFPAQTIFSKDGKPLLSWRVALLPYLEEQALYEQFRLDEPWDSDHNIKLLDKMPEVYRCPNSVHQNRTVYLALHGKDTFMDKDGKPTLMGGITDGTSNTIMFVEANDDVAVNWTRPADLAFDPDDPMRGLGEMRPGGFNAAFCDGSIRFLDRSIGWEMLRRMALCNDGEIVD